MYLIDGIGDEVLHFFIAILAIVIVTLAWRTTNMGNQWHMHTFYLLDGNILRRLRNQRRLTNHIEVATISESTMTSESNNESDVNNTQESSSELDNNIDTLPVEEDREQSDIVQTMDANICTIRQRRLTFYDNNVCNTNPNGETDDGNIMEDSETDSDKCDISIAEKNMCNTDSTTGANTCTAESNTCSTESNTSNIRIKLKYINDDLKLVSGFLEEQLGDFKRRHFNEELSSDKLVKLIFNGQILERESDTLETCGLFDNCVVHCLIHPARLSQSGDNSESSNRNRTNSGPRLSGNNNNNSNSREWDFGNVLIGLLSFILGTAWYFRYQYPHLFTVTATVALAAVTGIFTVISVGMYFPDPEPVAVREEIH